MGSKYVGDGRGRKGRARNRTGTFRRGIRGGRMMQASKFCKGQVGFMKQQGMMAGERGESCHGLHGPRQQVPKSAQEAGKRYLWAEVKTPEGKSYFYHVATRVTSWTRPRGPAVKIIQHKEHTTSNSPLKNMLPVNGPPDNAVNWSLPSNSAHYIPSSIMIQQQVPPDLCMMNSSILALAQDWSEHISKEGKVYYCNMRTGESSWTKPAALIQFEEMRRVSNDPKKDEILSCQTQPKQVQDEATSLTLNQKKSPSYPVSSTAIIGTPWLVVRTGDNQVFFYNAATKVSVWNRPDELYGNEVIDRLVGTQLPVDEKTMNGVEKMEATSTTKVTPENPTKAEGNREKVGIESEIQTASGEKRKREDTEENAELLVKAAKSEEQKVCENDEKIHVKIGNEVEKKNMEEKSVDGNGKRVGDTAFRDDQVKDEIQDTKKNLSKLALEAAKEREAHPFEIRLARFRDMLQDKKVSAFSTWQQELHKIVFDSRYLLLTSKERRDAFDDYIKERAHADRKEKRKKLNETKNQFIKLIEEALHNHKICTRLTFQEFAQKYGDDERFGAVASARDRERYFLERTFRSSLRARETSPESLKSIKQAFVDYLDDEIYDYHVKWRDIYKDVRDIRMFSKLTLNEMKGMFKIHQNLLRGEVKARRRQSNMKRKEERRQEKVGRDDHGSKSESEEERGSIKSDGADIEKHVDLELEDISSDEEDWSDDDEVEQEKQGGNAASVKKREEQVTMELIKKLQILDRERKLHEHQEDQRITILNASERELGRKFEQYTEKKDMEMKKDFRKLLQEKKMQSYQSKGELKANPNALKDIVVLLQNDKRYLIMSAVADERDKMLISYLGELEKQGLAPSPTASTPGLPKK